MRKSVDKIITLAFLWLIFLAALRFPLGAAGLQDPLFHDVLSRRFSFTPEMGVFRSQGLGITNIKGRPVISIIPQSQGEALYDLKLSFDGADSYGSYSLIRSDYSPNTLQKVAGAAAAKFVEGRNSIMLMPKNGSILSGSGLSVQSFTVDFWLYPYRTGEGHQSVLEFKGKNFTDTADPRSYGFSIGIEKNTLTYRFENFFRDKNTNTYSFELTERRPLNQEQWERHTFVLDAAASVLRIYRGGVEQQVIPLTADKSIDGEPLLPTDYLTESKYRFPLLIGKNALFSLDEFFISRDIQTNFTDNIQGVRFFETDVFTVSSNTSYLYRMNTAGVFPEKSGIRLAYRFSPSYFFPEDSDMPWIYIDPAKNIFPPSRSLGKYFQWRFEYMPPYHPAPLELHALHLDYRENLSPAALKVKLASEGSGTVTLTWDSLPDPNITAYEVYYGTEPGVYFGAGSVPSAPPSPLILPPVTHSGGGFAPMSCTLEGLENGAAYYIIVRVRDKFNKLGAPSEEIFARPMAEKSKPYYSVVQ